MQVRGRQPQERVSRERGNWGVAYKVGKERLEGQERPKSGVAVAVEVGGRRGKKEVQEGQEVKQGPDWGECRDLC